MQVQSKCDAVVEDILSKVVNRVYCAGERLPTESALCALYGVSRVTVRESLKKLEMMDVVSIEQGRGTFVKGVSLGNFMQPVFNLIDFDNFDVTTIYDARLYVETGTCRLAAENRTEEDLALLSGLVSEMGRVQQEAAEGYEDRLTELDAAFHTGLATASKNEILKAAVINLERISIACAARIHKSHDIMPNIGGDHATILNAVASSDPDAAEAAIVSHTLRSKDFLN